MLISFTLENWKSFRNEVTFSMIAGREKQHNDRVPEIKKYKMRVLPISAVYGGNASGKSNLFKALEFSKKIIVNGLKLERPIPVDPFRLDPSCKKKPSNFSFMILIKDNLYEFSFSVTRKSVLKEKLVQIKSSNEYKLYERAGNKISFGKPFDNDDRLKFVFEGTRDNQLFLNNSVTQKVDSFKPVYDWFKNSLVLISPESEYMGLRNYIQKDHPSNKKMIDTLSSLDTGIHGLEEKPVRIDSVPALKDFPIKIIEENTEEDIGLVLSFSGDRYLFTLEGDKIIVKKLFTSHRNIEGKNISFEMSDESDGTIRTIDLIPAFISLSEPCSNFVFFIDEINRSLHTLLIRQLLESYLESCSKDSRSQLIFTTHDVLLMDQDLMRRDEMWVTEHDREGSSTLYSFNEFKEIRYDKDIRKSYLQGRLGGVPRILLKGALSDYTSKNSGQKG
ncbi:MAG: ATP/GTP-binding protein [Chloroflexi bacterium]|nr:ATP/GTP-binding protein [Chloroflexota bacterium]